MEHLLSEVFKRANHYITELKTRRVNPSPDDLAGLKGLDVPLQNQPMDAFEVGGGAANHYGATGGMSPGFMTKAIALVKDYLPLRGCAIASYDPAFDGDSRFLEAGLQSIRQIVSS